MSTTNVSPPLLSATEFVDWVRDQDGRFELVRGEVVRMSPERIEHIRTKYRVYTALTSALASVSFPGEVLGDGASVRIDAATVFEPDAVVLASRAEPDAIFVADPVVVVEVVSPTSLGRDIGFKRDGYFRVASVEAYLVVHTEGRVTLIERGGMTSHLPIGETIDLPMLGITLPVASLFSSS